VPMIQADPDSLYRALVNFLANAVEAMDGGGRLSVRVNWAEPAASVLTARRRDRLVRLEIQDTGAGIAPADADRIFNPFFTTKDHGTGLGLALTHKIIEDHGGTITVSSRPEMGTMVSVLLPVVPDRRAVARRAGSRDETHWSDGLS